MAVFMWPADFPSSEIAAYKLRQRLDMIRNYINVDVDNKLDFDFTDGQKLETKHVYKPDLYGSPSPRMEGVSSQVHFRRAENDYSKSAYFSGGTVGQRYVAIPGLCTRVKMAKPGWFHYRASFYGFEIGGASRAKVQWIYEVKTSSPSPVYGHERHEFGFEYTNAAKVKLFVNGVGQGSTERRIKTSAVKAADGRGLNVHGGHIFQCMISRHQHSVVWSGYLDAGVHDIGLCIQPIRNRTLYMMGEAYTHSSSSKRPRFPQHKHIYITARSMVTDVIYEDDEYDITHEADATEEYYDDRTYDDDALDDAGAVSSSPGAATAVTPTTVVGLGELEGPDYD
tara:strand:+ start:6418 stop:7434 length:1017 start_codon:yes stop_codon:yes gene_type:complete